MSTFECKIRKIDIIEPHPNADRLELVVIGGYRAVVQKGIHKVGDNILYVPEDTVFTDLEIAEKLKIASYLTGKQKNRVKSIRLRGILSQGIVLPMSAFEGQFELEPLCLGGLDETYVPEYWMPYIHTSTEDFICPSERIIEKLKLEKYEEPIPIEMSGKVRPWPSYVPKYDIENIKRPESLNAIRDGEEVIATEKLHGTNMTVALDLQTFEVIVCSRNLALLESDTNVYWRAVKKYKLDENLKLLAHISVGLGVDTISLHGEVVGVQDLKYGYKNGDIGFYAFDIRVGSDYIKYDDFVTWCTEYEIPMVPKLYRGPYSYSTINDLCKGQSILSPDTLLEGLCVKPVEERYDSIAGRVLFKFINEAYLLRSGGSELH